MYRLWMTLMKRWKLMWFPIALWFGCLTCVALQLVLMIENVHNPDFGPYRWATVNMTVGPGVALIPMLAMSILLNAYCTSEFFRWQRLKPHVD